MVQWPESYKPEAREFDRQDNYEAGAVKYILRKCGWQAQEKELLQHSRDSLGAETLTLQALDELTNFPLKLRTKKLKGITPELLLDMQLRPTKTPIFEAFFELRSEYPQAAASGCLGLIFEWPTWAKYMLFHVKDTTIHRCGSRCVWYPGREHQPHILEPLDQFIDAMKNE
jgi:hypothetical protein